MRFRDRALETAGENAAFIIFDDCLCLTFTIEYSSTALLSLLAP